MSIDQSMELSERCAVLPHEEAAEALEDVVVVIVVVMVVLESASEPSVGEVTGEVFSVQATGSAGKRPSPPLEIGVFLRPTVLRRLLRLGQLLTMPGLWEVRLRKLEKKVTQAASTSDWKYPTSVLLFMASSFRFRAFPQRQQNCPDSDDCFCCFL